jgi:hypothetical protein
MSHNDSPTPTGAPLFSENSQAKTPVSVIIGFVLSLAGLFVVTAIAGIILGIVGLKSAKRAGKGVGLAWAAIIIGAAWLALFALVGVFGDSENSASDATQAEVTTQIVDETVEEIEAPAPLPTPEADPIPEPEPAPEPAPEPEPEPEPTQQAQEFSGRGDKILQFDSGPFVATITHRGNSNFAVWAINDQLDNVGLLVNQIGSYSGDVLGSSDAYGGLRIEADGRWTVSVVPVSQAPTRLGNVQGKGDAVFFWTAPNRTVARITHEGSSNFAVWLFTSSGRDLLVNEIGPYSGEQIIEDGLFEITADGAWTISPQ